MPKGEKASQMLTSCSGVSQLGGLLVAEFDQSKTFGQINALAFIGKTIFGIYHVTKIQYFVLSIFIQFKFPWPFLNYSGKKYCKLLFFYSAFSSVVSVNIPLLPSSQPSIHMNCDRIIRIQGISAAERNGNRNLSFFSPENNEPIAFRQPL